MNFRREGLYFPHNSTKEKPIMKSLLILLLSLTMFMAQELTLETEMFMPQGVQNNNTYFGDDFAFVRTQAGDVLFLVKEGKMYDVNHTKKQLTPTNIEARIQQVQQMTAMMGELKLKATGKTKKIKGLTTAQYKLTNVNGMASISGKVYTAEIKHFNMKKFKPLKDFQDKVSPFRDAIKNKKHSPVQMIMSVETGQGMPIDIESKITKYEEKLSDKIKEKVKEIRDYKIVAAKKPEIKEVKQQ